MITQFKLFEGISYPYNFKNMNCGITYFFTNKNNTKYEVIFEDEQMYYQTIDKGYEETKEFDIINVFTTLSDIINDYLKRFNVEDLYIDNIPTNKEQNSILNKVNKNKEKALDMFRKITGKRTEIFKSFLEQKLSKKYKITIFDNNANIIHIYLINQQSLSNKN